MRPHALKQLFLLLLLLAMSSSTALAIEPKTTRTLPPELSMDTPSSWGLLPGKSDKITTTATQTAYFGEEPILASALAYGHANHGALYLTWVATTAAHASPEAAIRDAFDNLHEAPFLATSDPGSTQEVLYRERSIEGTWEMRFEWAHLNNDTVNLVRAIGWKDSNGRLHLAIAECVLSSESVNEARPLCESSLDSLHLTSAAQHAALRSLAAPKDVGGGLRAEDIKIPKLETGKPPAGTSIGEAPKNMGEVLYRGRSPAKDSDQSNRFIIAIGILLLAAAFFLTTRSKDSKGTSSEESEGQDESDDDEGDDELRDQPSGDEHSDKDQNEEKAE